MSVRKREGSSGTATRLVYDAGLGLLAAAEREVEGVEQPLEELDGVALVRDLELLLGAEHHRLQHLVRRDVRLEVLRVPQLPDQLAEPLEIEVSVY